MQSSSNLFFFKNAYRNRLHLLKYDVALRHKAVTLQTLHSKFVRREITSNQVHKLLGDYQCFKISTLPFPFSFSKCLTNIRSMIAITKQMFSIMNVNSHNFHIGIKICL